MSTEGILKITSEVSTDSKIIQLIFVEHEGKKEVLTYCDSEEEAVIVVKSLANKEAKDKEGEWTEVFSRDSKSGREVILSVKELGRVMDGSLYEYMKFTIIPVGHAFLTKGILEMPSQTSEEDPSKVTSVPVPNILQRLAEKVKEDEVQEDEVREDEVQDEVQEEEVKEEGKKEEEEEKEVPVEE